MKIYGKKINTIDCFWEVKDDPNLKVKLESMSDSELVEYLNENGKYEEEGDDWFEFMVDYIGDDWKK